MDKTGVAYALIYDGILLSHKNERNTACAATGMGVEMITPSD